MLALCRHKVRTLAYLLLGTNLWSLGRFLKSPADCPHFKIVTTSDVVFEDTRIFQHIISLGQLLFLRIDFYTYFTQTCLMTVPNFLITIPILVYP